MWLKSVLLLGVIIFCQDASANCRGRTECDRKACVLGNILQLLVKYLERDDHHDACATINTLAASINKTLNNTDAEHVCKLCAICERLHNVQHPTAIRQVYATMAPNVKHEEKLAQGGAAYATGSALHAAQHARVDNPHGKHANTPGSNNASNVSLQLDSCQRIDHCRGHDSVGEKTAPATRKTNTTHVSTGVSHRTSHEDQRNLLTHHNAHRGEGTDGSGGGGGSDLKIIAQSARPNANRNHNDRGVNSGQVQLAPHATSKRTNDDRSTFASHAPDEHLQESNALDKKHAKLPLPENDDFVYVSREFSSGEHDLPNVKYTIRPGSRLKREYSDVELMRLAKMLNNRDFYTFLQQKKLLI